MIKQKQKQKQKHIRMIDHTHDQRCGDLKRRIKEDAWTELDSLDKVKSGLGPRRVRPFSDLNSKCQTPMPLELTRRTGSKQLKIA